MDNKEFGKQLEKRTKKFTKVKPVKQHTGLKLLTN